MRFLAKLLGKRGSLTEGQAARLEAWRALPDHDLGAPATQTRFIVADVESTGLDLRKDRLIAIGAVPVDAGRIVLGEMFYVVLRQHLASSKENILIHRIGGTEQMQGDDPVEALLAFLEFAGKAPLVGFHAGFDDIMIRRAMSEYLGDRFKRRWMDIAFIAPQVVRGDERHRSLDEWLDAFGVRVVQRHHALADALATAQLFQVVVDRAMKANRGTVAAMLREAESGQALAQQRSM